MKRREQYKRKLEFILDKISKLPNNFEENIFLIDALFYRLQVSIDATMDIIAMLCKDFGISVKDDYTNLDEIEKLKKFDDKLIINLRRWNGLRNRLVHKYNKIDESIIIEEKVKIVNGLKQFIQQTEMILNELSFSE
ncbi:MAG: DUF86 domain-containing protein [Promethearchaeota archaeon]